MRILGYARVSSREQAENSHALEQQIERLRAAGANEILADVESGSRNDRIFFNRIVELVKTRAVDEVIVTRLDRLTRSLPTLRKVLNDFDKFGVSLKALDDSINTSTAAGKFHLNILGALAEMEVDRLSERVQHGWAHLRDRKVAMNPPFGYIKVNDRHQLDHSPFLCLLNGQVERSKAEIAREIVEAYLEKQTLRMALRVINERYGIQTFANRDQQGQKKGGRVARDMFRFSPGGLRNWLTNPVLQGHTCYLRRRNGQQRDRSQWDIWHDTHPDQRLISDEEAQQIDSILKHNRVVRGYGSTALKYPLSGLVFCGECRSACYSTYGRKNYKHPERGHNYYYQCKNWRLRSCSQKSAVRMEIAEQAVIEALTKRAATVADLAELPTDPQEPLELKELRNQLAQLEAIPGHNPAIEIARLELRQQIENFQHRVEQQSTVDETKRQLLLQIFGDQLYWKTLLDEEKRDVYRALVDRIVIKNGQVERVELKV
jgi:site-specific DNA recombinase